MKKKQPQRRSMLPPQGGNLFQRIKAQCAEAEKAGQELIKLTIGQPSGPALVEARKAAAEAVMSREESMHEYQDNGSPGVPDFALRFINKHVRTDLTSLLVSGQIDVLPIPGIKPMLGMVIDSLGSWDTGGRGQVEKVPTVLTMTNPGYGTPADQCAMRPGVTHVSLPMSVESGFLFSPEDIQEHAFHFTEKEGDLIMLNLPHNPTGVVAGREWLRSLCGFCEEHGVRLFNDAAYTILSHTIEAWSLADVAPEFPNLNWAEAFSASKAGNFTGWRVGAMVGSPEFMADIKKIKGNTDSGFAAPLAAGILDLFENHIDQIYNVGRVYHDRLQILSDLLTACGMRLAVKPKAGFFALFLAPHQAFGQEVSDAEQFNQLMISNTGLVGVPFGKYIRYAVCTTDIKKISGQITEAFQKAKVSYN